MRIEGIQQTKLFVIPFVDSEMTVLACTALSANKAWILTELGLRELALGSKLTL